MESLPDVSQVPGYLIPSRFLFNASAMVRWLKIIVICFFIYLVQQQEISFSIGFAPKNQAIIATQNNYASLGIGEIPMEAARAEKAEKLLWQPIDPDLLTDDQVFAYIKRFEKVAKAEMKKFNIPASIKLAMGILESHADANQLTQTSNNHFGQLFQDKNFNSAWENWRAHSLLLRERFPELFQNGMDSERWVSALQEKRYSRDPGYYQKLREVIARFNLDRYDAPR